jgi:distribution and morphology protein 34
MAFNFNWSPLTADADFYKRAQEMLTTALNKSPKPPIIVDDILVNELNLGSVPPELEILEIGDLAEDRFRGIFKMCYSGDAFLTLKTRVQVGYPGTYPSLLSLLLFVVPDCGMCWYLQIISRKDTRAKTSPPRYNK